MPLETGTYISDLAPTNPAHTDGLNNADAHMRLIKSAVKATFPNVTGAVSASQTDLNNLAAQLTSGVSILKDTGVHFATHTFDGITNPSIGKLDIVGTNAGGTASVVVAEFNGADLSTSLKGAVDVAGNATVHGNETITGNLAVTGNVTVTGKITGPGSTPIGGMIMWLTDTLPADGNWCWANGGTLSRTGNGAALFAITGTAYGVGDGSTTFNVIDMQDAVPVGKDTMGGAAGNSLLASIANGVKQLLGALFGADTVTLSAAQLPAHKHPVFLKDPGHFHSSSNFFSQAGPGVGGGGAFGENINANTDTKTTGITIGSVSGTANDNQTADNAGGGSAHSNLQPSRVVNFIIRIA